MIATSKVFMDGIKKRINGIKIFRLKVYDVYDESQVF